MDVSPLPHLLTRSLKEIPYNEELKAESMLAEDFCTLAHAQKSHESHGEN
jgi:hypothetical protein